MTKLDYLKERLTTVGELLTRWAEDSKEGSEKFKENSKELSEWYKGRSAAYKFSADWILEIAASIKEEE